MTPASPDPEARERPADTPAAGRRTDALHGALDPEALFAGVSRLDEGQTLQWLGHLQRLASTGLLAGGMAHDLAGLITPLLAESERVLAEDDADSLREALVQVRAWARRCQGYVSALLDLVRRDELQRAPVPVEAVVEDTLDLLQSTRKLARVSLVRHLDNHHLALVDRTRLMQALLNLVTNAVRAARHGGHQVTVTVRGWRGWVLVEVEDDGPGVPAHLRGRLFQPFVQEALHGADGQGEGRPGRRTGLGLYITKRLIEEQGGRIDYETETGTGSVFRLMLEPASVDGVLHGPAHADEGNEDR